MEFFSAELWDFLTLLRGRKRRPSDTAAWDSSVTCEKWSEKPESDNFLWPYMQKNGHSGFLLPPCLRHVLYCLERSLWTFALINLYGLFLFLFNLSFVFRTCDIIQYHSIFDSHISTIILVTGFGIELSEFLALHSEKQSNCVECARNLLTQFLFARARESRVITTTAE
jgi:hypothetical protein